MKGAPNLPTSKPIELGSPPCALGLLDSRTALKSILHSLNDITPFSTSIAENDKMLAEPDKELCEAFVEDGGGEATDQMMERCLLINVVDSILVLCYPLEPCTVDSSKTRSMNGFVVSPILPLRDKEVLADLRKKVSPRFH